MPELDPVVFKVPEPQIPLIKRIWQSINANSTKSTKIITAVSAIVITLSLVTFFAFTFITNNKKFKTTHHISATGQVEIPAAKSGTEKSANALAGSDTVYGNSVNTGTNSPVVTLSATPASVNVGGKSKLKWSVTNNPKECVASDDWSGAKNPTGEEETPVLDKAQNYIFTLTCKTATGTGFSTVSVSTTETSGVGSVATRPHIASFVAKPSLIYSGYTTLLSWDLTNSPSSCTASGDWSGSKAINGSNTESTLPLSEVKTYKFTLTCSNSAGSETASVNVNVVAPPPDLPITVLLSDTQSPALTGVNPRLTWSATNGPTSCTATGDWSGAKSTAGGSQTVGPLNTTGRTYTFTITCGNSTGSTVATVSMLTVPPAPQVSLTASSSWQYVGGTARVTWSATNSPTTCTASGDWTGSKSTAGGFVDISLTQAKTYLFSLSCTNSGGTGFQNNVALNVSLPPVPVVNLSVSPIAISTGQSATLNWTPTNNPTSCTGSGNGWTAGSKPVNGPVSTSVFNTAGTYTFTLVCANAGGNSSASSVTLSVSAGGGAAVAPVASIALSPKTIGTGSSSTITWSATNTPTSCTASNSAGSSTWTGSVSSGGTGTTSALNTAGTYTFSVFCSNSAGTSATVSDTVTVQAVPNVTSFTASPNPITAGGNTTVSWTSNNSATSCTAGGTGWSGVKSANGSQVVTLATANTYTFTINCSNAVGTGPQASTSVTVNAAAVQYCLVSGVAKTPCYGTATMATKASVGNCWGWISNATKGNWVIDITNFAPTHPGGQKAGSLEVAGTGAGATCNKDILSYLNGSAAITGFKDKNNATTHTHASSTYNNTSASVFGTYMKGYYDPTNPN